jgi:IclR family acetate operon transcriptional repressor
LQLSERTGETVKLAIADGADVLNMAEVPSTYILNSSGGWIGRKTRPHAVANGKVLLAYGMLPMPQVLQRYTPRTITSRDVLARELAEVRRTGYAKAVAEMEEGLVAVAAPVLGPDGTCVAARSISGPEYRMQPELLDGLGALCAGGVTATVAAGVRGRA